MTIIEAITKYLEDNDIGTVGTDIFIGELPLDKNNIVSVIPAPSPEPNKSIPYFNQGVDIWARYSAYEEGYGKLQDILDLIHRAENYSLDGYHVYLSFAKGSIDDLDRDSERRHLFKLSLAFVYRVAEDES